MTRTVTGEELKKGLLAGVEKLNLAVSDTLGPYGNTVLIKDNYGKRKATKDGVSVARAFIEFFSCNCSCHIILLLLLINPLFRKLYTLLYLLLLY